ncbi:MAG: diadenylate cyclase CdaA [Clostridia bacterium]|nr:diadenylate cyclase CdaA [Clostridia bacterium]
MTGIVAWIVEVWTFFISHILSIGISDVIDIILVSVLIYYIYKFIRERRAGKLAMGIGVLALMMILSNVFELSVINYFMKNIFQIGLIAAVIIFQPELRSLLENMGGDSIKGLRSIGEDKENQQTLKFINEVCEAVGEMSMSKTGALIVIEQSTKLGDIIATGTTVNADTSSMLIRNIFFNKSPLHDGAMIIRDRRIFAAGCLLPLATKNNITKELGTRHRAAIGASEASDALVVVVSEETGTISLAHKGHMHRGYDVVRLKAKLDSLLIEEKSKKKSILSKKNRTQK